MKKHPDIRKNLIVATKGGFIPYDIDSREEPSVYFQNHFVKNGILRKGDICRECHSLKPEFIREYVLMSLENPGLEYLDIYYIHNPEMQLSELSANEFYHRLSRSFEVLEKFIQSGRIHMYGTATWDGYRLDAYDSNRLSLRRVIQSAEAIAAGSRHHFRAVQFP